MHATRYPETGAYQCAADLFAALQAAAADAPEFTLPAILLDESRRLRAFEELPAHEIHRPGFAWVHGPVRPACGMLTFSYVAAGTRCVMRLQCLKPRLLAMAEQVRKHWALYGGGPKPAELTPARKPRAQWRAGAVQVWREAIEDRDYSGAAVLAESLGVRYYSGQGRAAYALVAPEPLEGMPAGFYTARRCDGRWVGFEENTGLSVGCRNGAHGSRRAAAAAALAQWEDMDADKRAHVLHQARETRADCAGTEARAQWLREHGAAPVEFPADPAPVAPVQADPEPVGACPILRDWQAAAMLASVPQVETEGEAAAMEAAALARFGVRDPLASLHLPAFPDWHRETLASLRAPEPGPAAPAAPAMPRPVPAGLVDPSPWRADDNAAARARVYSVHCRTAIAAAQAAGPALKNGARLRRSVNEAGFPAESRAMRAGIAQHLRAERAAARYARAAEPCRAMAGRLELETLQAAKETASTIRASIDAATPDPAARRRLFMSEAARLRESARVMRWPVPEVGERYDAAAVMLQVMAELPPVTPHPQHPPADDGAPAAMAHTAAHAAQSAMAHPDPVPANQVPAVLAELRRARGWSVADMAAALGFEGENGADRVRELERKARAPTGTVRQLLAYMLADTGPATKNVPTMPAPDKGAGFAPKQHDGPP